MSKPVILTPEMARQVLAMISQVHIPAGQAAQAVILLEAVSAIANGLAVVRPAERQGED
jgi:hypothetical protein